MLWLLEYIDSSYFRILSVLKSRVGHGWYGDMTKLQSLLARPHANSSEPTHAPTQTPRGTRERFPRLLITLDLHPVKMTPVGAATPLRYTTVGSLSKLRSRPEGAERLPAAMARQQCHWRPSRPATLLPLGGAAVDLMIGKRVTSNAAKVCALVLFRPRGHTAQPALVLPLDA